MTTTIPFIKMHGIGNDYVYLDAIAHPQLAQRQDLPELARRMSDRHAGIGSDGLIVVQQPRPAPAPGVNAHVQMRMFNADGSESEMCGNGIRCVAKLVHDRGYCTSQPMYIATGAGVLAIEFQCDDANRLEQATVNMGMPRLEANAVPVQLPGWSMNEPVISQNAEMMLSERLAGLPADWIERAGVEMGMTCVSMGNPHVVLYCSDVAAVPLHVIGPWIETYAIFPRRVNVHFVQIVRSNEVHMRTWERGAGMTQACGTGASAVCVAGVLTGKTDRRILAHLPGGDLTLEWRAGAADSASSGCVFMTGPATEVFTGDWQG
ncbi:MAG: diaminopimelate epimerase [Phycisphaerales bacterium]